MRTEENFRHLASWNYFSVLANIYVINSTFLSQSPKKGHTRGTIIPSNPHTFDKDALLFFLLPSLYRGIIDFCVDGIPAPSTDDAFDISSNLPPASTMLIFLTPSSSAVTLLQFLTPSSGRDCSFVLLHYAILRHLFVVWYFGQWTWQNIQCSRV